MTKRKKRTADIFPSSGNLEVDQAWAVLIAQRDLELLDVGYDQRLTETLHAITGKQDPSDAELAYYSEVIYGQKRQK